MLSGSSSANGGASGTGSVIERPLTVMKTLSITIASVFTIGGLLEATETKPNVLFIAVDDMRCDLGCYGSKEVLSPNIDRLASSGVRFDRAYCQVAVCNPSRASLMTGLRPDTLRVWDLPTNFRTTTPDAVTLPQHFRKHGYRAVAFGKIFHNPFPDDVSWDEPTHQATGVKNYSESNQQRLAIFKKQMVDSGKPKAAVERMRGPATEIQDVDDDGNFDGKQTTDAIARMRELAAAEQPFFLAVGYIRPHLPLVTPKKYWDLYQRDKITLAPNPSFPRDMPAVAFGDRSMGGFYELRDYMDYADAPSPFDAHLSEDQQRELKHGYYASVSFVDAQVGRLLDALEQQGLAQNTIVVLWSDHGWKLGEHGGWCKQTNYEIDTRAPLIVRAPNAKAKGQSCSALVEFVDVYPTLCDLAQLPTPTVLEGKSFAPLLSDTDAPHKDAAFSQFERTHEGREFMGCAIRTDRYRYIEWRHRNSGKVEARELYDHQTDPQEDQNIADAADHQILIQELSARAFQNFRPASWGKTAAAERPKLTVVNNGRQAVDIFWLPEKGEPKKSGTLAQGERQVIKTTMGHRFLIQGTKTGFKQTITVTEDTQQFVLNAAPNKKAVHP